MHGWLPLATSLLTCSYIRTRLYYTITASIYMASSNAVSYKYVQLAIINIVTYIHETKRYIDTSAVR